MALKATRFVNLLLAGTLAGNEFGTWSAVHPALEKLGAAERVRAEQEVTRRFGDIMPFWMASAILSCAPVLVLDRGGPGFRYSIAGALCLVAMLISTRLGNVPINERVLELSPESDGEEFVGLRERWDRLHTMRVALTMAGSGLLAWGTLAEDER